MGKEKHCHCGLPATHEGPACCYHYERNEVESLRGEIERQKEIYAELLAQNQRVTLDCIEAQARADASIRVVALTEKYHNEDMLLMQVMEKVIADARLLVNGPDAYAYSRLSGALDAYDQARRERDRTY